MVLEDPLSLWTDLRCKASEEAAENTDEEMFNLRDLCNGSFEYVRCKDFSLSAVLDANPLSRQNSIEVLKVKFDKGDLRKGYVEDGNVYLKIRGNDGLLRTFFVGNSLEYTGPSGDPVHFDFDKE